MFPSALHVFMYPTYRVQCDSDSLKPLFILSQMHKFGSGKEAN